MKNRVAKNNTETTTPSNTTREVTFTLPTHLADLIEQTRGQVPGAWETWLLVPAYQSLERPTLELGHAEFESLMVDGEFDFEDDGKRETFMLPLLRALDEAYVKESALRVSEQAVK